MLNFDFFFNFWT